MKRDQEGPGGATGGVRISHDGPNGAKRGQGEAKMGQEGRKWPGGAVYGFFYIGGPESPDSFSLL